jgi:hypothetical protein
LDPLEVQQSIPTPLNNEGMLPSRSSSITCTNIFGEIWTTHINLGSLGTSSRGQTPRFHTPRSEQGIETKLDEHIRTTSVFQQATEYSV